MGHAADVYDRIWETMEVGEWQAFMALFHPDVEVVFQDRRFTGLAETEAYFRNVMRLFPDIRHRISAIVEGADGSRLAGWVTAQATSTGSRHLFGNEVDIIGRSITFEAVDFLFFREGLVSAWWAMLDYDLQVRNLGLDVIVSVPEASSKAEQ